MRTQSVPEGTALTARARLALRRRLAGAHPTLELRIRLAAARS